MFYLYFLTILLYLNLCNAGHYSGWGYINVHCRNNDNAPLPWWFIYKPPSDQVPFLDRGINFSYLSPEVAGRWQVSNRYLIDGSMLQHTLSPIFKSTYVDYVAIVAYEDMESDKNSPGSGIRGVLITDELGGVWMTYSIRGFPDFTGSRPKFPEGEIQTGHMITCLSLDLLHINEVLMTLLHASPKFNFVHVPERIRTILPDWVNVWENSMLPKPPTQSRRGSLSSLEFVQDKLRIMILARQPGDGRCLYRAFAKSKGVVLDVYNPSTIGPYKGVCTIDYGVRRIHQISLKVKDSLVSYIENEKDKSKFAVSTFAHWQRTGSGPDQQWTCFSNLHLSDISGRGGHILCIDNYDIWLGFDNLKIKEPECP